MATNITVYSDYTTQTLNPSKTVSIGPELSNYKADYLLIHFDQMITREIANNPDVIYDPQFQQFMLYVSEYERILLESRKGNPVEGPFGTPPKIYSCTYSHIFTDSDSKLLNSLIKSGQMNPKIYVDDTFLRNIGLSINYYQDCGQELTNNFFPEVAIPTNMVWEKYLNQKSIKNIPSNVDQTVNMFSDLQNKFNTSMAQINDQVTNGDYAIRYSIIEKKITDIVDLLDSLTSASQTEENIIENSIDIDNYYEKLSFKNSDIDSSLEIPKDSIDLIEREKIAAQLQSSISKYSKMTTPSVIASTYNMPTNIQNIRNVGSIASNLLNNLTSTTNITNPPQELRDLMLSKIYRDDNNNIIIKYLDETSLDILTQNELDRQSKYLNLMDTSNYIDTSGSITYKNAPLSGTSRVERYLENYPNQKITMAGGKMPINYDFGYDTNQKITISQSGGRNISISNLLSESQTASDNLSNIVKNINDINTTTQKQNDFYFKNKNFMDINNLNQRNELLIEIMSILNIYNFFINGETIDHKKFFQQLENKINQFKEILNKFSKSVDIDPSNSTGTSILNKLLANGNITISEIKNLLTSHGINIKIESITNDEIVNNASTVKLLSSIINKNGINNISAIVNDLNKIFNRKNFGPDNVSTEKLYQQLYTFYSTLESLNSSLITEYHNIINTSNDMNTIKNLAGNVMENNIDTFNIFSKEMISQIQNFGINVENLQNIRKHISQSKKRLTDFEIYMKEIGFNLYSKKDILEKEHIQFTKSVYNHDFDIKNLYKYYVTDYADQLKTSSSNVIKYYSYRKDLDFINKQLEYLLKKYQDYYIIRSSLENGNLSTIINNGLIVNVDNNFNDLSRNIWEFIQNLSEMRLMFFPHITNRINMPPEISQLIQKYLVPSSTFLNNMMTDYILFNSKGELQTTGFNINQSSVLMDQIVPYYILYNNNEIDQIKNLKSKFDSNKNDVTLYNLYQFLLNLTGDVNKSGIRKEIQQYLENMYQTRGGSDTPRDIIIATQIKNTLLQQIETIINDIYQLFYEKISRLYEAFIGLILTNSPYNNDFQEIQQHQHQLLKQSDFISKIRSVRKYQDLNLTDNILLPVSNGSAKCANYLINSDFNLRSHNIINCNLSLIRINSRDNNNLVTQIHDKYNEFYNNASPILDIMRNIISNGDGLLSDTNIDFPNFDILQANELLLPNSYKYNILGITENNIPTINTFIINNNNNGSVFKNYQGSLSAYLPSFLDDTLILTSKGIEYTYNNRYLLPIKDLNIPALIIKINDKIKLDDVNNMINLLNTGKYLSNFIQTLHSLNISLSLLDVENIASWNTSITVTDISYPERINKKTVLLNVIGQIELLTNTIVNNNNYYYLDTLINGTNNFNATILYNLKSIIEDTDPIDYSFNSIADRTWIFLRKLVNIWYTLCSQMLSSFILNDKINHIIQFTKILDQDMDPTNLYNLDIFDDFIAPADNYYSKVRYELIKKLNQIKNDQNQYPIDFNNTMNPIVKYNHYYTNLNNTSSKIYVMMALMNEIGISKILPRINSIDKHTQKLVTFVEQIDGFLNPEYLTNKINKIILPATLRYEDLIQMANDMYNSILSDLEVSLNIANALQLYDTIKSKFTKFNDTITNYILNVDNYTIFINDLDSSRIFDTDYQFNKNMLNTQILVKNEYDQQIQNAINNNNMFEFFRLYIADIYRVIFNQVKLYLQDIMNTINKLIVEIKIQDLQELKTYYQKYFDTTRFNTALFNVNELSDIIQNPTSDRNSNNIKYILFEPDDYTSNINIVDDINDVTKILTQNIKPNLYNFYENELNNYNQLMDVHKNVMVLINDFKDDMQDRIMTLRNMTDSISLVMFNDFYKQYAFIDNSKLLTHLENIIDNYENIWRMTEQKIYDIVSKNNYHVLALSQINNYQAFKSSINKTINNKAIVSKFYKRMSFGLIEYYYDILDSIVTCLDSKSFDDMSNLESYLYQYHYIQLKRCYMLFKWIREDYQKNKQMIDDINIQNLKPGAKYDPILKYKIQTMKTTGDSSSVFLEFQGLRKYLDEYSAVAMDKVQLHLRINDFVSKNYNNELNNLSMTTGKDVNFLLDVDPTNQEYNRRWETGKLIFINENNGNNLKINFDLLDQINKFNNPDKSKDFGIYYSSTYRKMKPVPLGIDFERIYNTKIFPDSDVISNYMSIAPNILNNKGTVIMTYGYSGVGKSASLFGRKMDISKGIDSPSNGILQATMDQFTNIDIYFRVFEIYGLGTQYNYYWNPTEDNNYQCYPDFYQCIIHHVLDTSNPNTLGLVDQLAFTNRHDMLAYIMDLKNPATGTNFTINNINDPNLSGKTKATYNKYFDSSNKMIGSTYAKITENHYRNFTDFVDQIDQVRTNGIPIKKLFNHIIKQVKGTINNPISSRSILVYDFEINLDPKSTNPIFVPFLIYDLPGKEDIGKTYVDTAITPDITGSSPNQIELRKRVFKDIEPTAWRSGDSSAKERKSTYVLNPLLIPIYDDNVTIISNILTNISSFVITIPTSNTLEAAFEQKIVQDILSFIVDNFGYTDTAGDYFTPNKYPISSLYQNPGTITTFTQLLDMNNIDPKYYTGEGTDIDKYTTRQKGIPSVNIELVYSGLNANFILNEIKILVCVVIIGFLIQYKLFDVIVEIINQVVEGPGGSDNDNDGGWSRSKIYAFYEAYYINENVVGLLQYLITSVLNKSSDIQEQTSTINGDTITNAISDNYRTANRYRVLRALNNRIPDGSIVGEYKLIVNPKLLQSTDILKSKEISDFILTNDIDTTTGKFAENGTPIIEADQKIKNVISFENRGDYDTNKIFRSGNTTYTCNDIINPNNKYIINPIHAINTADPVLIQENNRPLLQDFIEPYEQKISFYYVFYVVSNSQSLRKAEEQIKLLNNSMPFIDKMDPSTKKKQCV
ncbi:P-loop containing nucleoside triphosphate hydrolase domain-containing protein [Megavirus chiliensis]|uniref:Kinesin n=2 Tax=Megamimivirinae TaxID=3044648 RepID=A0A2L2DMR0_MIMIV|nr:kinesin-like protein [Megavirus chiliensis]AEQ33328.1 P-loop containing nucleoside triphosphate hydrolase domain-containing protein [Megavirus chiliensis]AVG47449.1 kinesin [Acanthamoeba polyphaga mimivirus]